MDKKTSTISRETYLMVLGLLTLGKHHYEIADQCGKQLCALLDRSPGGHMDDVLFGHTSLEDALRYEGISVEPEPKA